MGQKAIPVHVVSRPSQEEKPQIVKQPWDTSAIAEMWLSSPAPRAWGQELGSLELGAGLSHEDVAEETEAEDDHTKPNPLLPPFSGVQI